MQLSLAYETYLLNESSLTDLQNKASSDREEEKNARYEARRTGKSRKERVLDRYQEPEAVAVVVEEVLIMSLA